MTIEDVQDARLAELEMRIEAQLAGLVRNLRLIKYGVGFILRGQSSTYHGRQFAQGIATEMLTPPIIANEIEVI